MMQMHYFHEISRQVASNHRASENTHTRKLGEEEDGRGRVVPRPPPEGRGAAHRTTPLPSGYLLKPPKDFEAGKRSLSHTLQCGQSPGSRSPSLGCARPPSLEKLAHPPCNTFRTVYEGVGIAYLKYLPCSHRVRVPQHEQRCQVVGEVLIPEVEQVVHAVARVVPTVRVTVPSTSPADVSHSS
jgi:hypothetical protein